MTSAGSRIFEYIEDRRFVGQLAAPTLIGKSSLDGRPPHTTLHLRITDGIVSEGRFQTSGCGYLIASCGALIELALGRSTNHCTAITEGELIHYLGGLPEHRGYCATLAIAALRDAITAVPQGSE